MTEWNAGEYRRQSGLQQWVAEESLAGLTLEGSEKALDLGCGDGRITAEIATRLPRGSILGLDPSTQMIAFAREHTGGAANLSFAVGDATQLGFRAEFDLVVSFNALHWVLDQSAALAGIHAALRPSGRALLQFVSRGERKSLEAVIEETAHRPEWAAWFAGTSAPFVHFTPEEYRALAEQAGFAVRHLDVRTREWDFGTRQGFVDFARVTFVEWTRRVPADRCDAFIADVLDRYCASAADAQ